MLLEVYVYETEKEAGLLSAFGRNKNCYV